MPTIRPGHSPYGASTTARDFSCPKELRQSRATNAISAASRSLPAAMPQKSRNLHRLPSQPGMLISAALPTDKLVFGIPNSVAALRMTKTNEMIT